MFIVVVIFFLIFYFTKFSHESPFITAIRIHNMYRCLLTLSACCYCHVCRMHMWQLPPAAATTNTQTNAIWIDRAHKYLDTILWQLYALLHAFSFITAIRFWLFTYYYCFFFFVVAFLYAACLFRFVCELVFAFC